MLTISRNLVAGAKLLFAARTGPGPHPDRAGKNARRSRRRLDIRQEIRGLGSDEGDMGYGMRTFREGGLVVEGSAFG